jgi:serine/threonine protein kinase
VFEYLDQDLKKHMDVMGKSLNPRLVKSYMYQLIQGMCYCHQVHTHTHTHTHVYMIYNCACPFSLTHIYTLFHTHTLAHSTACCTAT